MGMKKSVVAISACESLSFHTAASSAVSMPTISCGGRKPGALALRMSDSTPGRDLAAAAAAVREAGETERGGRGSGHGSGGGGGFSGQNAG